MDILEREVLSLRTRVAELQRAAARHDDDSLGMCLAEREELLQDAERAAHLGTWTWDIESGRVAWSDEMFRILGFAPGSVKPSVEAFFEAIHPDDRAACQTATEQGLKEGVLPLVDCRVVRPDNTVRRTSVSGSYLFDAEGSPKRMVGSVLDLTERLKAQAELKRILALLEEAQSSARLGSWRYDLEAQKVEWSSEFRRIVGLSGDTPAKVETFISTLVPEDQERFSDRHSRQLMNPQGGEIEGKVALPDGRTRDIKLTGSLVRGESGQLEVRGTIQDVTEYVRMREELVHSQKMEAVGRLAGGIAHDFNNLLTIVIGNLEILQDEVGSSTELQETFRALDSATNMTRRLLAFGRKAQLTLHRVDPNQLIDSLISLMGRLVGDEITLETKLSCELPQVAVDPLEMERALVNLVVNARDVMPQGGTVTIATALRIDEGKEWVEISIGDEGPGIDPADLPQIFEPFFTTRGELGGSGMGLATVMGTAEQHGGSVRVEERPTGGSLFVIQLPAAQLPAIRKSDPPTEPTSSTPPKHLKLLVVDDEPAVAKVTKRMLTFRGHEVLVATTPSEAQKIWKEQSASIDLVICDVVMSEMRGPVLIERLGETNRPRVLFISGYNEEAVHAQLEHPVLAKPFSAAALEQRIGDILARVARPK